MKILMGKTTADKAGHGSHEISGGLDNLEVVYFWGSEFFRGKPFLSVGPWYILAYKL